MVTSRHFAAQPALALDLVGIALENCTALCRPCRDVNEFFPYYWGDNESKDDLQRVRIPLLRKLYPAALRPVLRDTMEVREKADYTPSSVSV